MNPFYIVCMLIALTPLMRGSVHAWPETVIQIIVVLGLIVVVVKGLKKEMRGKKGRSSDSRAAKEPNSRGSRESDAVNGFRDGLAPGWYLWWVMGPVAALGVWSTMMSPHPALAMQGLIMLVTCLGFSGWWWCRYVPERSSGPWCGWWSAQPQFWE